MISIVDTEELKHVLLPTVFRPRGPAAADSAAQRGGGSAQAAPVRTSGGAMVFKDLSSGAQPECAGSTAASAPG